MNASGNRRFEMQGTGDGEGGDQSITRVVGSGEERVVESSAGNARMWSPAPGILCTVVRGTVGGEIFRAIGEFVDRQIARDGRLRVFHDWYGLNRYDRAARQQLMDSCRRAGTNLAEVHVLYTATALRVDIALANVLVDGAMIGHRTVESFQRARTDAISVAVSRTVH